MKRTNFRKIISIVLICLTLATVLASCKETPVDTPTEESSSTAESTAASTQPTTVPLIENGATKFTLLKPIGVTDEVLDVISDFRTRFKKHTGITLQWEYEDQNEAVNDDYEILIGVTRRPESTDKIAELKYKDFFYGIVNNKLVIAGTSAEALAEAVQLFFRQVLEPAADLDAKNITLKSEDNYFEKGSYYIQSAKIGDVNLSEFNIVYSDDDLYASEIFAKRLAEKIRTKSGYALNVIDDSEPATANEIVVGKTNRGGPSHKEDCYSIKYENNKLYFSCGYSAGYDTMFKHVSTNILTGERNLVINESFNVDTALADVFTGGTENVLSKTGVRLLFNNVWSGNESTAPAKLRAMQLADVYNDYNPDVIGLQEYSGAVKTELAKQLKALGYIEIPYTNSNNKSIVPRTPIFYNPQTLTLKDSGFWRFGDTSGDVSKSIGWALFEEKATGKLFIAGSTHFYWTGDELGKSSRIINARELSEQMKLLSEKYDAPVIIGGDYNCNLSSDPLKIILNDNKFSEAENLATKTEFGGTHHSYPLFHSEYNFPVQYYVAKGNHTTAIDHIFMYNTDKMNVHLYDVIEDYFALGSSDHCPMITDITLK